MSITWRCVYLLTTIFMVSTKVSSDDSTPIPEDTSQVETWFKSNVLPFPKRITTLDAVLRITERGRREIKVRKDGTGDFKTVTEAIASISDGNTRRVVVNIGPGIYNEKILIPKTKPFVTLRGNPSAMAVLQFSGTAKKHGTFQCGTFIVMSDYFNALFLIIKSIR